MKIGIITFQMAWNCGAVLQCYALQEFLRGKGFEVVIINYCPKYKAERYKKYPNPLFSFFYTYKNQTHLKFIDRIIKSIKASGRTILNYSSKSGRLKLKRDFESFCNTNLILTRKYISLDELKKDAPECDVYISGSDQLWNPKLTNWKLDGAYFLDFGKKSTRRITYAVSACELDIFQYKQKLNYYGKKLDAISLREIDQKEEFEEAFGKEVSVCLDPTFLIPVEEYKKIENNKNIPDYKYILVYALDNPGKNDVLFNETRRLKQRLNLPVYVIAGPHKWPYQIVQYKPRDGISPGEFLSFIKNAETIITNSFHATVFSILYRKEFFSIGTPGRSNRIINLLNCCGLSHRMLTEGVNSEELLKETIDFESVFDALSKYREVSIHYLGDNLKW